MDSINNEVYYPTTPHPPSNPHPASALIKKIQEESAMANGRQLVQVCLFLKPCLRLFLLSTGFPPQMEEPPANHGIGQKLNVHCFEKCVPTPGSSFSRKEETCLNQCLDKYMATWKAVSQAYIGRLQTTQSLAPMEEKILDVEDRSPNGGLES